eukprot:scaffold110355_cov31-Tisochrysis_lutea.AAC.5
MGSRPKAHLDNSNALLIGNVEDPLATGHLGHVVCLSRTPRGEGRVRVGEMHTTAWWLLARALTSH